MPRPYSGIDAFSGILCWIPEDCFRPTRPSPLEDDEIGALQSDVWFGPEKRFFSVDGMFDGSGYSSSIHTVMELLPRFAQR